MNQDEFKVVEVNDLRPGPIRHLILPDWFLIRAQLVYHILRPGCPLSFPEFIENFQRDAEPERELLIWERVAAAFVALSEPPGRVSGDARDIVANLLTVSMIPIGDIGSMDCNLRVFADAYGNASAGGRAVLKAR